MQINASKSALHKVGHIIVEGHLEHCIKESMEKGDTEEALADVSTIFRILFQNLIFFKIILYLWGIPIL